MTTSMQCCDGDYCLKNALRSKDLKAARRFSDTHPITLSTSSEKINNLKLAIQYLPDINLLNTFLRLDSEAVHFLDSSSVYPLAEATLRGDPKLLQLLFDHSANANFFHPKNKKTALHHLAKEAIEGIVSPFLAYGAQLNESLGHRIKRVIKTTISTAGILFKHGALTALRDSENRTPLKLYIETWEKCYPNKLNPDFIYCLIAAGADPLHALPVTKVCNSKDLQEIQQAIDDGVRDRMTTCNSTLQNIFPHVLGSEIISFLFPEHVGQQ